MSAAAPAREKVERGIFAQAHGQAVGSMFGDRESKSFHGRGLASNEQVCGIRPRGTCKALAVNTHATLEHR